MTRRFTTLLFPALCVLALVAPLSAQRQLNGVVRFADGRPAAGVRVLFFDPGDLRRAFAATTDAAGGFTVFAPISPVALGANYPNPFNPSTAIPFALVRPGLVRLEVFNALGQRVRLLRDDYHTPGAYTAHWNGRDERGFGVAAGVYFYRLTTDGQTATGRMVLVDGSAAPTRGVGAQQPTQSAAQTYAVTLSATFRADDGRGGNAAEQIAISVVDLHLQLMPFLIETQAPSFVNILFQARDDQGRDVDFLSTENFEIFENNRPVSPTESALQVRKKDTLSYTLRTVLMIDNSASVASDLAAIRAAAVDLVRRIVPQQVFAVYKFSDSPLLVQDFTNEVDFLVAAIEAIQPEFDTTDLYGAIARGTSRWEDIYSTSEVQQGFLIVLTDGSDTQASTTLTQALITRGTKQVYTLGLGDEIEPETLAQLGNAGYFPLANASELGAIFTRIQTEISLAANSFYWLNYLSPKRSDNLHTLRLQVKGNALDSSISGQFNSADFYSVLPGVYVNVDSVRTEGIDTLARSISATSSSSPRPLTKRAGRPTSTPAST